MKYQLKPALLPRIALGAGILGALARAGLYAMGVDDGGLLIRNHPLHILCWVLAILVAVAAAAVVWKLDGSNNYHDNFPAAKMALAPAILAACGILSTVIQMMDQMKDKFDLSVVIMGLLAAPAMAFTGYCRLKGKRPAFFLHGLVCLFWATHLVCRYRVWSGNPQLPDYDLQLLASVFLMLTAYQHMAFDAGLGRRRMQLFCSLMAGSLGIVCAVATEFPALYLTGGAWALCNLCVLTPPVRHPRPEENKEEP